MTTREAVKLWPVGQVITDEDLNRASELADDIATRVWEALVAERSTTSDATRVVLPLDEATGEVLVGEPSRLVVGLPGPAGYVRVKRFRVVVGAKLADAADVTPIALTARTPTHANVGPFASNASGLDRADLVVARVRAIDDESRPRLRIDPATKQKATDPAYQLRRAVIELQVVQGTPGVGTPAPPADDHVAGEYFVPLARVDLPDGYTTGTVIPDNVPQLWPRGGVHRRLVAPGEVMVGFGAGATPAPQPSWSDESGARWCEFVHVSAGALELGAPSDVRGIDWRNRLVRLSLVRAVDHTGVGGVDRWPSIASATRAGASVSVDSGWRLTGGNAASFTLWNVPAATLGTPSDMLFYVEHTTGKLFVNFLGAPGTPEPQRYYLRVQLSDRFVA